MALTVSLNHESFPDGTEFGVAGAFVVPNGGSAELTKDQESLFASNTGALVSDELGGNSIFTLSGRGTVTEVPPPVDDRTDAERGVVTEDEEEVEPEPQTVETQAAPNPDIEGGEE